MNLLDFIEKLQNKPEATRQKIAVLSVFVIMLIIVVVWLSISDFGLKEEAKKISAPGPLSVLIENFKEFRNLLKENF